MSLKHQLERDRVVGFVSAMCQSIDVFLYIIVLNNNTKQMERCFIDNYSLTSHRVNLNTVVATITLN